MATYTLRFGTHRREDGSVAEPGDTVELTDRQREQFNRRKFDPVDDGDEEPADDDADGDDEPDGTDGGDEFETQHAAEDGAYDADVDAESDDGDGEPDEWHDWNEDAWMDLGYEQRAEDVRAGRVDDHLGDVESAERSDTVLEAVEDRRSELED